MNQCLKLNVPCLNPTGGTVCLGTSLVKSHCCNCTCNRVYTNLRLTYCLCSSKQINAYSPNKYGILKTCMCVCLFVAHHSLSSDECSKCAAASCSWAAQGQTDLMALDDMPVHLEQHGLRLLCRLILHHPKTSHRTALILGQLQHTDTHGHNQFTFLGQSWEPWKLQTLFESCCKCKQIIFYS